MSYEDNKDEYEAALKRNVELLSLVTENTYDDPNPIDLQKVSNIIDVNVFCII